MQLLRREEKAEETSIQSNKIMYRRRSVKDNFLYQMKILPAFNQHSFYQHSFNQQGILHRKKRKTIE